MTPVKPVPDSIGELCVYTRNCLSEVLVYNNTLAFSGAAIPFDHLKALKLKTQVEQKAQLDFIQCQTKDLFARVELASNPHILEIAMLFGELQLQHSKLVSALDSLLGFLELDPYLYELEKGLLKLKEGVLDHASVYEGLQKGIDYLVSREGELSGMQGLRFSLIKSCLEAYKSHVSRSAAGAGATGDVEMEAASSYTASTLDEGKEKKKPNFLSDLEELLREVPLEGPLTSYQKKKFYVAFGSDAYVDFTYALVEPTRLSSEDKGRLFSLQERINFAYKRAVVNG